MTRDQALIKIKKLLRLAGSSNPNEAAIAMRQANVLMREYQLTASDAAGVEEKTHEVRGKSTRVSLLNLFSIITQLYEAQGYTTPVYKGHGKFNRGYVFVSDKAGTVEVCQYAFEVLARQLNRDCKAHISRVKKAANRAARGDIFGIGWTNGLRHALQLPPPTELVPSAAVAAHLEKLGLVKDNTKARTNKSVSLNDRASGFMKGVKAKLHSGVNQARAELEAPNG